MADDSYCVLVRHDDKAVRLAVARIVAEVTGQVALDVARRLCQSSGILASGLPRHQAERMVGALSQAAVSAFALPQSKLVRFPEPVFLETARLGDDALAVQDLRAANGARLGAVRVPYKDLVFIVTGRVSEEKRRRVGDGVDYGLSATAALGLAFGGPLLAAAAIPELVGDMTARSHLEISAEHHHVLDLFAVEPAHHLRLNAKTFNFTQTGLPLRPTAIENLAEFAQALTPLCERTVIDPSVTHILDRNPLTSLKWRSLEEYEAYVFWRIQLLYHPG